MLTKSNSHMSIPRRTSKKKEASRVDESQARTRASLLRKNKARKMKKPLSARSDSREGRDPEGSRELKNTIAIVFKSSRTWEQCLDSKCARPLERCAVFKPRSAVGLLLARSRSVPEVTT